MEDFSQEFQQENDLIFTQFFDDSKKLFFRIIHGITCLSIVRKNNIAILREYSNNCNVQMLPFLVHPMRVVD